MKIASGFLFHLKDKTDTWVTVSGYGETGNKENDLQEVIYDMYNIYWYSKSHSNQIKI